MQKVFIVQGWHWHVPGEILKVFGSKESAAKEAAEIVQIMVNDLAIDDDRLKSVVTPENWKKELARVQKALKEADYGDEPDVIITEHEVVA